MCVHYPVGKIVKSARVTYSVDWLQVFCSVPKAIEPDWVEKVSPYPDSLGNHRTYKIASPLHFIKGYTWQRELIYHGYTVATIACHPVDERYRIDGGAVKLANAVLYVADWYFILMDILAVLGWRVLNITRVDLAADFNYFMGGLDPATFLRKYVCRNNASYLRIGSNKFALYGQKEMHCTIFDSIRWGSRQSGVSVYMYNKTKELDEKKDKPYIRKAWEAASLSSTRPVWRVEISITSQGLGLKNIYSHMVHNLFVDEFRNANMTRDMFKVYAAKYFRFVKTDPKAKRKRDLKEVTLLDVVTESPYKPIYLQESCDTGRMERIVSNKLVQLKQYLISRNAGDKYVMLNALDKCIQLYNVHHNIKKEVHSQTNALEDHVTDTIVSVFQLPDKSLIRSRLHAARVSIDEWDELAKQMARQVIKQAAEQSSCTQGMPPPRAAARNDSTPTTSPIAPTPNK